MFTFGRDHEAKHVLRSFGDEEKASMLVAVVNATHDLIEGKIDVAAAVAVIKSAFIEGKSGVWEKTGGWLLKINNDYPESTDTWRELSQHKSATVRFRVASFIIDFPADLRSELYEVLTADKSKKVKDHADGKWDYCQHPEKYA